MASDPSSELRPGTEGLSRDHDFSQFDCGKPPLTEWLTKYAWQNQLADAAKTYVACRGNRVAGYYSLVASSIQKSDAPERVARGLANHPIGVILLARLALDQTEQGQGLGKALLKNALVRTAQAAEIVGVRALLVHAMDEEARRFYLHFNFEVSPVDSMHLMLLMKDLRVMLKR
jgi:GNAT superfamily N-acetyltransferase